MFNKIQPKQIQLHAIGSTSGHLDITQDDTSVTINLKQNIPGDINFVGNLQKSGVSIYTPHSSNTQSGNGSYVLGGQNNTVTGIYNMVVNGRDNYISGNYNLDLNGDNNSFGSGVSNNTILAGQFVSVDGTIQGSTCIKDSRGDTTLSSRGTDTLNIKFDKGTFVDGNLYLSNSLYIDPASSGLLSGNLNVIGSILNNGSGLALNHVLTGDIYSSSGALNTKLNNTGANLYSQIIAQTGTVKTYGNQSITGVKTFANHINFYTGFARITETGAAPNYIDLSIWTGDASVDKYIEISSVDSVGILLDSNNSGQYSTASFTGKSVASFIIGLGDTTPDYNNRLFMVHPSGIGYFKDRVIMNAPSYVPTANSDTNGISGEFSWDSSYLYCKVNTGWGRVAWDTSW